MILENKPPQKSEQAYFKFLVIDDNIGIYESIKIYLEEYASEKDNCSIRVVHAEDGSMALNKISNERFDLFIIDNQLPKTEGLELIQILKQSSQTRKTPIIFISGIMEKGHVTQAATLGVKHILIKPIIGTKLIETIRASLSPVAF
jgi:CheY-like chemotaxis protein